ncbi:ATP-binding protein [Microbacterium sp. cf332]|uniref:ATP-binding protein n=1 Tax=Microbacterium sp. cf332 TaxID=1761804 RepID=UPI00089094F8|nr:ATP-binding protein [Microbacterium sp. cf332]SDQ75840.1 phage shock protein C (PspC) family protein [Microbacterium sp. cf332]
MSSALETAVHPGPPPPRPTRAARARPMLERRRDCLVSGVSPALATHLGVGAGGIRVLFVSLAFVGGAGPLLYLWLWALVPWQPGREAPTRRAPIAWILVSAGVAALPVLLAVLAIEARDAWMSRGFSPVLILVTAAISAVAVAGGCWATFVDRRDVSRGTRHAVVVRAVSAGVLVVVALLALPRIDSDGIVALPALVLPVVGMLALAGATLANRWRELSGERVRRIREEQRSAMAAHLHDSVLQTLALIQNTAGASSEAARIARAQERELRAWLFDGEAHADSDLPTDLRDHAAALELDFAARIDVVSAGLSAERASGELAAAAREAMLNAARHAGGDVSVYIEGGARGVDVWVRDRGPGFDVAAIPDDRLGVRESIVGRMRRAGGGATVRPAAAGGTEVHLHVGGAGDARG